MVLTTFGTSPGGALADIGRILKKKDIGALYFDRIPTVENYIALFGPQSAKTQALRSAMQKEATERVARNILAKTENNINLFRPFSCFVSSLFSLGKQIFYKRYRLSDSCTGCGICAEVCPVAAIKMQDKRPVFTGKCEHCQGCLNWCPQIAIQFGRLGPQTPRYHHPGISAAEIKRRP